MIVIEHETEFEAINAEASRRLRGQCVRVAYCVGARLLPGKRANRPKDRR